jgi:hypothetical protein
LLCYGQPSLKNSKYQGILLFSQSKYSIFAIQKLLKCAVGDVKSPKKLRNGAVLIEVTSKAQADKALKMTNWIDVQVKV